MMRRGRVAMVLQDQRLGTKLNVFRLAGAGFTRTLSHMLTMAATLAEGRSGILASHLEVRSTYLMLQ